MMWLECLDSLHRRLHLRFSHKLKHDYNDQVKALAQKVVEYELTKRQVSYKSLADTVMFFYLHCISQRANVFTKLTVSICQPYFSAYVPSNNLKAGSNVVTSDRNYAFMDMRFV